MKTRTTVADSHKINHTFVFNMLTIDTILKELKNVPADRLEDLYAVILSLRTNTKKSDKSSKKILSFAGSFSDMPQSDYNDFLQHTKRARNELTSHTRLQS